MTDDGGKVRRPRRIRPRLKGEPMLPTEVAARLRISRTQVYDHLKSGELKCTVLGPRSRRITEEQLDQFLKSRANS